MVCNLFLGSPRIWTDTRAGRTFCAVLFVQHDLKLILKLSYTHALCYKGGRQRAWWRSQKKQHVLPARMASFIGDLGCDYRHSALHYHAVLQCSHWRGHSVSRPLDPHPCLLLGHQIQSCSCAGSLPSTPANGHLLHPPSSHCGAEVRRKCYTNVTSHTNRLSFWVQL